MQIKLQHQMGVLTVFTNHDDPDLKISPQFNFEGNQEIRRIVEDDFRGEIELSAGIYGHLVNLDSTTNLDLAAAVRSLPSFTVISIEPEIEAPPMPEDVQT